MIPSLGEIAKELVTRYGDGGEYEPQRAVDELADHFKLTPKELAEHDGSHPRFYHKVHSALAQHCKKGLLVRPRRGRFQYLPDRLVKHEPRHYAPRQPASSNEDQFSVRDLLALSDIVARNGKDKVLLIVQSAF